MGQNIIIPVGMKPLPKPHEESAAIILAKFFDRDVCFIETASHGTPDISINGVEWELKSPIGSGKNNIQKHMREASKQARNVVIDLRRSKLHQDRAIGYIRQFLSNPNELRRVLVITKTKTVLEIMNK